MGNAGAVGITAGGGIRIQVSPRLKPLPQFSGARRLLGRRRSRETATAVPELDASLSLLWVLPTAAPAPAPAAAGGD